MLGQVGDCSHKLKERNTLGILVFPIFLARTALMKIENIGGFFYICTTTESSKVHMYAYRYYMHVPTKLISAKETTSRTIVNSALKYDKSMNWGSRYRQNMERAWYAVI